MSKKKSLSKELDITSIVLMLIGISLLFLFTTFKNLSQNIVDSSTWGLLAIGTVSGVVAAGVLRKDSRIQEFFFEKDLTEAGTRLAIGAVIGIVFIFVMSFVLQGIGNFVYNATGSLAFTYLGSMTETEAYFVGFVQPMLETFVIVVPFIALLSFFMRLGTVNLFGIFKFKFGWIVSASIAFIVVVLLFSAFHFMARGQQNYEASFDGFTSFIFNASPNAIQTGATGFPQLLLGISFMLMALYYRDFLVPAGAHLSNNLFVIYFSGLLTPGVANLVLILLIILGLLVIYSIATGNFFKYAFKGSLGEKAI